MFKCKVCAEKDQRVSDLKSEIEFLRKQLVPQESFHQAVSVEQDYIMNGAGEEQLPVIPPTPEERAELDLIQREKDALLSGNY